MESTHTTISGLRNMLNISENNYVFICSEYNFLKDNYPRLFDILSSIESKSCDYDIIPKSDSETFLVLLANYKKDKKNKKGRKTVVTENEDETSMEKSMEKNIDEITQDLEDNVLKTFSICVLQVKKYKSEIVGEIFSPCPYSSKSIKRMITYIQRLRSNIELYWIGVSLDSEYFNEEIERYIHIGFLEAKFMTKSYTGDPIKNNVIGLVYDMREKDKEEDEKGDENEEEKNYEIIQEDNEDVKEYTYDALLKPKIKKYKIQRISIDNAHKIRGFPEMKERSLKYNISMNVLSWIKKRVDLYGYEYGGPLLIDDVKYDEKTDEASINLILAPGRIHIGNKFLTEEDKNTDIKPSYINYLHNPYSVGIQSDFGVFRTYPKTGMLKRNLFFSQPSIIDMKNTVDFATHHGGIINFVAATEGIYSYQLSPKLLFIMSFVKLNWYGYELKEQISTYFWDIVKNQKSEKFMDKFKEAIITGYYGIFWEPTPEKKEFIQKYLKFCNTATLSDIFRDVNTEYSWKDFSIDCGINPDEVNIFIMTFTPWETMLRNRGLSGFIHYYPLDDQIYEIPSKLHVLYPPRPTIPMTTILREEFIR